MRLFREATGKSQSEIADALKIGLRSYQRYESGESIPSIDIMYLLAKELNVDIKDLISPEHKITSMPNFKIYKGEEEKTFLNDSVVKDARLVEIFNSPLYQQSIETKDIKTMRDSELFMNSPYPLAISQPRHSLINHALQKKSGLSHDYVPTTTGTDDLKKMALTWGLCMGSPVTYFEDLSYPRFPKGKGIQRTRGIFSQLNGNYQILSVNEIELNGK